HQCSVSNPSTPDQSTLSLHDALPIFTVLDRSVTGKHLFDILLDLERAFVIGSTYERLFVSHRASRMEPWPQSRGNQLQGSATRRSEEHTSELQSRFDLVCRLLLEKKR